MTDISLRVLALRVLTRQPPNGPECTHNAQGEGLFGLELNRLQRDEQATAPGTSGSQPAGDDPQYNDRRTDKAQGGASSQSEAQPSADNRPASADDSNPPASDSQASDDDRRSDDDRTSENTDQPVAASTDTSQAAASREKKQPAGNREQVQNVHPARGEQLPEMDLAARPSGHGGEETAKELTAAEKAAAEPVESPVRSADKSASELLLEESKAAKDKKAANAAPKDSQTNGGQTDSSAQGNDAQRSAAAAADSVSGGTMASAGTTETDTPTTTSPSRTGRSTVGQHRQRRTEGTSSASTASNNTGAAEPNSGTESPSGPTGNESTGNSARTATVQQNPNVVATDSVPAPAGNAGENVQATTTRPSGDSSTPQVGRASPTTSNAHDAMDRVRFVQRVARAFEMLGDRQTPVRLRLHPPELGSLKLEVAVRNGAMTARLEVENATARATLLDSLPALRQRLATQQIRVDRFEVDVMNQSPGQSAQHSGNPQPEYQAPQGTGHLPHSGEKAEQQVETPRAPRSVNPDPGRLDLIV